MIDLPTSLIIIGFLLILVGLIVWVRSSRTKSTEHGSYRDPLGSLSLDELVFFERAAGLPSLYSDNFSPSRGNSILVPAQSTQVGHLRVLIEDKQFNVKVGDHTDVDFYNPTDAIDFIEKILLDEIVFCFFDDRVETYAMDDFDPGQLVSKDNYVWSGEYRDKQLFEDEDKDQLAI